MADRPAFGTLGPHVVYEQSVESLFLRALRPRLGEACLRELSEAGLDLGRPLRPQYSEAEYVRYVQIARRHLFPHLEDAEAYLRMGRMFVEGYLQTAVGGAFKILLRLLGPERNLARMPGYFEAGTNYIQAKAERLGERDWAITVSHVAGNPTFTQGSLEEAMRLSGVRDAAVDFQVGADGEVRYHVRWGEAARKAASPPR